MITLASAQDFGTFLELAMASMIAGEEAAKVRLVSPEGVANGVVEA